MSSARRPWRGYRRGPGSLYRKLKSLQYLATRDRSAAASFLCDVDLRAADMSGGSRLRSRFRLLRRFIHITNHVRGYHTLAEMLEVSQAILRMSGRADLTVVEAGAGYGSSTAKLSWAVAEAGGRLLVFDSFRGIPPNDEVHRHLDGRQVVFRRGAFTGRLAAVRRTIERFGVPEVCEFHKGWFEDTLADFTTPVDIALLDVDLLSSTQTCLRALYPRLRQGGAVFSQDGHLEAIVALMRDAEFWASLGVAKPQIRGLGTAKLLRLNHPSRGA
ncbi:MAG: TylF/MycF/NovP-related O-methyltransferase [Myxococcota bacterium]